MNNNELIFKDKILDNVHGFIKYTEAEGKIINMLLFKRMQSIKQLSIVNWIFPGSEHTRYVHSLGVMHLCDQIALQLNLSNYERRIVRFAGLLHDIGHYPLSHVCEFPYKTSIENIKGKDFCKTINESVKRSIDSLTFQTKTDFMTSSGKGHHEFLGAELIRNNSEILEIIQTECEEDSVVDIICDMITGNVSRNTTDALLVQILHSELDADGIDYMLRDATFSGTSFGSFELDLLIRCMKCYDYKGTKLLCINSKGIAAADQYLINKFFSYSQIVCNKHVSILEWMAEIIVDWMQKNDAYFPNIDQLIDWINYNKNKDYKDYLTFTDNFFWTALNEIIKNPAKNTFPKYIIELCNRLLNHQELDYIEESEFKIISNNSEDVKLSLQSTDIYAHLEFNKNKISLLTTKSITKNVPENLFKARLYEIQMQNNDDDNGSDIDEEVNLLHRLIEGICVSDDENDIHLLCDDKRSLMQKLYDSNLVILRSFNFPNS